MRARCLTPDNKDFPRWGGRGITVCKRWDSFENFLADMGKRPTRAHSLDRYPDNKGNYEPGNCRWATMREQSNNRKSSHFVEFRGQRKTVAEWCRELSLRYGLVLRRINSGWDSESAFMTPPEKKFARLA
jgi:hypothetical protein